MCHENYDIEISKVIEEFYSKMLVDNVILRVINMLKDIIY
jgi:hypothetical protein